MMQQPAFSKSLNLCKPNWIVPLKRLAQNHLRFNLYTLPWKQGAIEVAPSTFIPQLRICHVVFLTFQGVRACTYDCYVSSVWAAPRSTVCSLPLLLAWRCKLSVVEKLLNIMSIALRSTSIFMKNLHFFLVIPSKWWIVFGNLSLQECIYLRALDFFAATPKNSGIQVDEHLWNAIYN